MTLYLADNVLSNRRLAVNEKVLADTGEFVGTVARSKLQGEPFALGSANEVELVTGTFCRCWRSCFIHNLCGGETPIPLG